MPNFNDVIQDLPQSFRREQQELDRAGINRWSTIRALTDLELGQLARSGHASPQPEASSGHGELGLWLKPASPGRRC